MITKFDHAVIFNGKLYSANTPIEINEDKPAEQSEAHEAEKVVENGRKNTGRKPKSKSSD